MSTKSESKPESKEIGEQPQQDPKKLVIDRDLMVTLASRIGTMSASLKHIRMDAEGVVHCVDKYLSRDVEILDQILQEMRGASSEKPKQPKKGE